MYTTKEKKSYKILKRALPQNMDILTTVKFRVRENVNIRLNLRDAIRCMALCTDIEKSLLCFCTRVNGIYLYEDVYKEQFLGYSVRKNSCFFLLVY